MPEYIGAYRLESLLGRGGMGEVFLAWDERLERRVAIKRIREDAFALAHQRERFRREARMAARLSHAAVVQIHDLVLDSSGDGGDAIVMEYVQGTTLAERMAQGPLETIHAVRLAREIAEGLAAAHAAGLIHRDLKAENVIVTPLGHAKILDFGLARPLPGETGEDDLLTHHGAVLGTSYAMSPEQAGGEELDERSDLFSLGVLLRQMLTGRSPFLGENSLGTLKRVLTEQPPALASVRPGLPAGLASLADSLLAKNRDQRPRSAEQVARKLERIERELAAVAGGEQSTAAFPVLPWLPAASPPSATGWALPRGGWLPAALAVLMVLAATAAYLLTRSPGPEPLRVIVVKPEIPSPEDEGLALTASGLLTAALNGLGGLQGIVPLDPSLITGSVASPLQAARNVAADEVLVSAVQREGELVRVSLRRIRADGGQVLWSDSWVVPMDPGGLRLLADMVGSRLGSAYPASLPHSGALPRLQVRNEDYSAFLEIRQRIDSGKAPSPSDLEQLDRILRRSPRFLEGWIQAAKLAVALFRSTHEPADLERARMYVDGARRIAPDDTRTLRESFNVALQGERNQEAEEILRRIEAQLPGDPDVLFLRYRLLDGQGRTAEAEKALRSAVERAPSWRNVYWLAKLETDRGRVPEARQLLEGLLAQSPGNVWAQGQLAYLELVYGDLERAERIYGELALSNSRHAYTNLGAVRLLRRRYPEAKEALGRALELQPGDITTTANLADAEWNLGNRVAAKALYGAVLRRLADSEAASRLPPEERMTQAHCLARLGRTGEAGTAVRRALGERPGDPQLLHRASLVHALIGDGETAVTYAKAALDGGIQPRFFADPAFDPLRREISLAVQAARRE
ncbi:MAG TPA: protein kinase [Thermoanaerobaculia bacterium]|nr:protein kinase [Thermoanaerobaculia bacterium]